MAELTPTVQYECVFISAGALTPPTPQPFVTDWLERCLLYFGARPVPPGVFDLYDLQRANFLTDANNVRQKGNQAETHEVATCTFHI